MVPFFQQDVLIMCSCGSLRPLIKLYFCRHCIVLRCNYCVCHEVDSIYCSNCLENLASSEAKLKKNRCGTCFECPFCFHTLTIRASTISRINPQVGETGQTPTKTSVKSFYLSCFYCRWTSRDAKIPDQPQATSTNWPQHTNPHTERINSLIDYYKILTMKERLEKENRMFFHSSRRNYQHFSEKFGLSAMLARKRAGLPPLSLNREDSSVPPQIKPAVASEDVEPLPEDIFTTPVDTVKITSLSQRFTIPDLQPENVSDLFPVHKQLFIKRSQRCKSCLHNIFKPEYGPASIKFKIHQAAYYYVPEIKVLQKVKMFVGKSSDLLLKICNPAQIPTDIKFYQFHEISDTVILQSEKNLEEINDDINNKSITDTALVQKKNYPLEKPRSIKASVTGTIDLPNVIVSLPARDDTTEYDDINDSNQYQDNPAIVTWRKGNKVILKFTVMPNDDLKVDDDVLVGFIMRFTYYDKTISPLEQKEGKDVVINVKHFVNVGPLCEHSNTE